MCQNKQGILYGKRVSRQSAESCKTRAKRKKRGKRIKYGGQKGIRKKATRGENHQKTGKGKDQKSSSRIPEQGKKNLCVGRKAEDKTKQEQNGCRGKRKLRQQNRASEGKQEDCKAIEQHQRQKKACFHTKGADSVPAQLVGQRLWQCRAEKGTHSCSKKQ